MYIYTMSKKALLTGLCFVLCFIGKTNLLAQQSSTNMIQPPYLKAGDTVAIVAPSGILINREAEVKRSKALLKSWGLHVVVGKHVFSKDHHFAGTDAQRCEDLQQALDDPSIKAIWSARGGYGTVRIIDRLDWTKFKQHPKWIIGYSDITVLHNTLNNLGYQSLHALMCTSMTDDQKDLGETLATFKKALFGKPLGYTLKGSKYNQEGSVTAPIVGGNLTILQTMLGSKSSIGTKGKILFIEEIGEYKYHIDRLLQSLKRAGYFDGCAGVIIGDMTKIKRNTTPWGSSIEQLITDALSEYDFPIAFNMPAGHEPDNRALFLGRTVRLTVGKEQSTVVFQE